jgi:hypothetical protein
MNPPLSPNKISDETLLLFKQVIEDDLRKYAQQIVLEQPQLNLCDLFELIPQVLETPIMDKINSKYRDTSQLKYKKELNRYSLSDLKAIAKGHDLKISGNRSELMNRISEKISLRDYTPEDIQMAKSYQSNQVPKKKRSKDDKAITSNYVVDSD